MNNVEEQGINFNHRIQEPVAKEPEVKQLSGKELDELLDKIVEVMTEKFNDREAAINNVKRYLETGNSSFITRTENLRETVTKSNFREQLNQTLAIRRTSLFGYYMDSKAASNKQPEPVIPEQISATLVEIIQTLLQRFQKMSSAVLNAKRYLQTGDPTALTRMNGLRERIVKSGFRGQILEYIRENNMDIDNFVDYIAQVKVVLPEPEEVIKEEPKIQEEEVIQDEPEDVDKSAFLGIAIQETYRKYEEEFTVGNIDRNGESFVKSALLKVINTGDYTGFTRKNNARKNLQENLSPEQILNIVKYEAGIDIEDELSIEETAEVANNYVEICIKQVKGKQM